MGISAGLDLSELDELTRRMLETAEKRYPAKAKQFLRQQANETRKAMRHAVRSKTEKHTNNLYQGIGRGRTHKHGEDWQIRVFNRAPHAYLVEHGHGNVKNRSGKSRIPAGTPIVMVPGRSGPLFVGRDGAVKRVEGRHPAADATEKMKAAFPRAAEDFVDELMREGLEL